VNLDSGDFVANVTKIVMLDVDDAPENDGEEV